MRSLWLALPVALGLGACSQGPGDGADDSAEALSTRTIQIDRTLPFGLAQDFTKTFTHSFERDGRRIDGTLATRVHFDASGAKITGSVTVGKRFGQPVVLAADLAAKTTYTASLHADVDVRGTGTTDLIQRHRDEWRRLPLGGASLAVVKNVAPLDIPLQGPLFLHTHFDLGVACELVEIEGSAHLSAGSGVRGGFEVSMRYDRDRFGLPPPTGLVDNRFRFAAGPSALDVDHEPTVVTGEASHVKARCGVQPTLVVLLERTVGAKIIAEPYVDFEANKRGQPASWSLAADGAGVEGFVQTDVEIFGHALPGAKEFPLFDQTL